MRLLGYAVACACLLVVGVSAGAWAGVTHPLVGVFGAFASPGAVAVQQSSGDVFVLDRGANAVARFDAGGVPVVFAALGSNVLDGAGGGACPATPSDCDQTPQDGFAFDGSPGAAQVAVDQSGGPTDGEVYVTDSFHNVVDIFAPDGHYLGQLTASPHTGGFGETCGVAVDSTGTVYVAETSGWVHRYSPLSNPVTDADFSSEFFAGACNLAVDSSGDVFANQLFGAVNKYSPAGDFEYTVDPGPAYGVAVDPASDQLYVVQGSQVAQYDASSPFAAALLGSFGNGQVGTPAGVGVRGSTNQAYVSDASANDVAIFGAGEPTPDVTTGSASSVSDTAATLKGTVNPNGTATTWQFQYGTDTSYGQTAPASPGDAGSGSSDVAVSTDLTGLQAGTTYHFRLVATGTNGTSYGADQTFTTQAPPTVDAEFTGAVGKTTATVQALVNPFGLDTSYHFDYHTDTGPTTSTPESVIPAAYGDQLASADLSGLQSNTTYHYQVVATNALGSITGPDQTFTTQPVLNIDREYVTGLGPSTATLNADIDPLGDPTTYHFEYGTTTAYGTTVPASDATVGSGFGDVTVSQPLSGLSADTLFHYRVVATNPVGTIPGPDHTFRTRALPATTADSCPNAGIRSQEQASFLPDCRAYEMVSPSEKNGGEISAAPARTRAAVDGNAVQFVSMAAFGDVHGTGVIGADYISQRANTGWATHGITPPQTPPAFPSWRSYYMDFSPDLSTGVFFALSPVTNEDPNVAQLRNLYLRRDLLTPRLGHYQLLSGCNGCTGPLTPTGPDPFVLDDPTLAAASADFHHVIFESPIRLTSDAPDNQPPGCMFDSAFCHPYLYESVDGHVRLAGILPDDTCTPAPPPCPAPMSAAGDGAHSVDDLGTMQYTGSAISRDGSKIIFTAGPFASRASLHPGVSARMGDLYMRIDGTSTVHLNASERSTPDPAGPQPALYGGASEDGTKVFFMTRELLTDDTQPGGGMNLYRYDLNAPAGHHLTVLTHDTQPVDDGEGENRAHYVVGTSRDGSYVYFWGSNGLLPGQVSEGLAVKLLYVWHDGALRFLGSDAGGGQVSPTSWGDFGIINEIRPDLARVSPDGRHAVFVTPEIAMAQSVGFDNRNASCENGGGCAEVYLYDYATDRVTCVSCDPGGGQPVGDASFATNSKDATKGTLTQYLTHAITDDGQRVFFDTPDALVARDTNGKRDVYEYDARTGRVSLISTGHSSSDSLFVEATPSGSDVFFTTRQQLVGIDGDAAADLYDARVGGGIAAQSPPATVECSGEGCRAASAAPPTQPVVASVTFHGAGNAVPAGGRVRVLRRLVHGAKLVLVVRVPAAGRITVHGASIGTVARVVRQAGTYRLRLRLTAHARRLLRHRHLLVVRLRVSYRPTGGRLSSVLVVVRVKA